MKIQLEVSTVQIAPRDDQTKLLTLRLVHADAEHCCHSYA